MDSEDRTASVEAGTNGLDHPNSQNISAEEPNLLQKLKKETTFFRAHLAAFTFVPLIFSGIFFASNGRFHISFLDSMFLCYSAMTVTGLSTVNLSTITTFQQVILYFLMTIGDITIVSWVMVLIRKRFFKNHCEYTVAAEKAARKAAEKKRKSARPGSLRSRASFMKSISAPIGVAFKQREPAPGQSDDRKKSTRVTPQYNVVGPTPRPTPGATLVNILENPQDADKLSAEEKQIVFMDKPMSSSPKSQNIALSPTSEPPMHSPTSNPGLFSPLSNPVSSMRSPRAIAWSMNISPTQAHFHPMMTWRGGRAVPKRGTTMMSSRLPDIPGAPSASDPRYQGLGGFPGPVYLFNKIVKRFVPRTYKKFERTMTMSTMTTLNPSSVRWLNVHGVVVGRNSNFHTERLTDEQLEDIGGAEYRALRLLSYIVPAYFILCQLFAVILFLPWLSVTHSYDNVFAAQFRIVSKPWFAFFQVMGAYTGGGLSLVDLGMVPFSNAYLMIIALIFVILAGNHALPIFLRLIIWTTSKILPEESEAQTGLSFLLEHPRRCFLYLFPSHQTWFLVIVLILFSLLEWFSFLVLNIGIPVYDEMPKGPRTLAGLFQGLAARASGFSIVPLASLAPALQFLYVVMMYIAVYPVALSIRSTNVYEERSLGVFEAPPDDEDEEPDDLSKISSGRERVHRYLSWHLRRQMSIDIWWLVWAVFLVAIIERGNLLDPSKKWFDLFRVLFELVSAFGGIGLSLGLPTDNFSFVGAMSPLSKLVVIVIMVRGRHRGLPVAVDRAVVLPSELITGQDSSAKAQEEPRADNAGDFPDSHVNASP